MTRIVIFSVCLYAFLQAAKFCVIRLNKIAEFFDQLSIASANLVALSLLGRETRLKLNLLALIFFTLPSPLTFYQLIKNKLTRFHIWAKKTALQID